ncbi:hypothetical protein [Actinomadura chokoriensis]|uniref:Uncharacterized protein n=1 Tax=Actinomadura chokoriensis TaxID=454156 RepID=A0ABV4RBC9_9ACTN
MPAPRAASRPPAAWRTLCRSTSSIRSMTRCFFHRTKYQYTVFQGEKSAGSCR